MNLDLNQITVSVTDVERSIIFYEKLGLRLIVKALPRYARFECVAGNTTFSLHQTDDVKAGNGTVLYFETDDPDEDIKKLKSLGITFDTEPTDMDWLWREARFKDHDGNDLVLYHAGKNRKDPPWKI